MRSSVFFILFTVFLDSVGIGIILPVMPDLIQEVQGHDLGVAAIWGGVLATAFAVMQFVCGPTVGNISDRFGRRPVLLVALAVMALDYLVMAIAGSIWLLLVGRIIGGITAATHSTATAYMADISTAEEKAARFGLIGAAFGAGFVAGPVVGGLLADWGTRAPFYAAAIFAALNFVFGYFVLPETVTDAIRRPFSWKRANPLGAFGAIGKLPGITPMLVISFMYSVALYVYPAIWAYFGKARFDWSPQMIGASLAAFGVGMALVQGLLVAPAIKLFGERRTVMIGFTIDLGAFIMLGFIENGWLALALTPLTALGSIAGPPFQGMISKTTPDNQQGELQGVLTSINALATIFAPLIMTQMFWYFTEGSAIYLPGAPFLMSAVLVAICITMFATLRRK